MSTTKHPVIPLKAVKSSQIAEYGYDAATQTLAVRFAGGGGLYHYHGVTPQAAAELEAAKSKGKHFMAHIRNRHDFVKVS